MLFAQDRPLPEILEEVARLGSRNGYREVTVKATAGPVTLARPKLRGTAGAFASRLFGAHVTKTNALESLVIASFVRGLSVRDVEATLAEALGDQAAISKSTVSAICQQIKGDYEAWARRRLDGVTLDYLFLDASFFRMHPGSPAEPVLAAWGITTDGKPAFIGLGPGAGESFDAWKDLQAEVKDGYWAVFDTEDLKTPPGSGLVEIMDHRIGDLAGRYQGIYPAAAKILLTGREGLTAYLRFPAEHHNRLRHSNVISAPSARPAAAPRSSAGSPARPAASPWSGPCSTGPPADGAAWP